MNRLKIHLSFVFLFLIQILYGQTHTNVLNGNNIAATVSDKGRLFTNPMMNSSGYGFPSGSGNHLIYNAGFWFGGTDQNSDLKLAANLYRGDFYRGPFSSTNSYLDTAYIYAYESGIWHVKKSDIIYHIDNYNQPGYVTPKEIEEWPGNGNSSIGVAVQLAPYVDVNNNGVYEPHLGEYPCIKGDEASYQIMHDDGEHLNSGGERIGAEVHIMVYQI